MRGRRDPTRYSQLSVPATRRQNELSVKLAPITQRTSKSSFPPCLTHRWVAEAICGCSYQLSRSQATSGLVDFYPDWLVSQTTTMIKKYQVSKLRTVNVYSLVSALNCELDDYIYTFRWRIINHVVIQLHLSPLPSTPLKRFSSTYTFPPSSTTNQKQTSSTNMLFKKLWAQVATRPSKDHSSLKSHTNHNYCEYSLCQWLYHCCPHQQNPNCAHYWYPQRYEQEEPCIFVTKEAYLARPDWKYLDPPRLRTTAENPSKGALLKQALKTVGRAARRYCFGRSSVKKEKLRLLQAEEEEAFCEIQARELVIEQEIENGYLGLGVWQHDLDHSQHQKEQKSLKRHFQSLDEVVMAGIPRPTVEHKLIISKEDTSRPTPVTLLRQDESRAHITGLQTSSNRRSRVHTNWDGLGVVQHGTGEVLDVPDERGRLWLAVERGDANSRKKSMMKEDCMRLYVDSSVSEEGPAVSARRPLNVALGPPFESFRLSQEFGQIATETGRRNSVHSARLPRQSINRRSSRHRPRVQD